jgi:hypothetical protein
MFDDKWLRHFTAVYLGLLDDYQTVLFHKLGAPNRVKVYNFHTLITFTVHEQM